MGDRDTIAGVELHAIARPWAEVEIRIPFDDPGKRTQAMIDFAEMASRLAGRAKLTACWVEGGEIVWRFGEFVSDAEKRAFNDEFSTN